MRKSKFATVAILATIGMVALVAMSGAAAADTGTNDGLADAEAISSEDSSYSHSTTVNDPGEDFVKGCIKGGVSGGMMAGLTSGGSAIAPGAATGCIGGGLVEVYTGSFPESDGPDYDEIPDDFPGGPGPGSP